jgi:hypothetical protein
LAPCTTSVHGIIRGNACAICSPISSGTLKRTSHCLDRTAKRRQGSWMIYAVSVLLGGCGPPGTGTRVGEHERHVLRWPCRSCTVSGVHIAGAIAGLCRYPGPPDAHWPSTHARVAPRQHRLAALVPPLLEQARWRAGREATMAWLRIRGISAVYGRSAGCRPQYAARRRWPCRSSGGLGAQRLHAGGRCRPMMAGELFSPSGEVGKTVRREGQYN